MKNIILLYFLSLSIFLNAQQWAWGISSTAISALGCEPITTDKIGNTYEAVVFSGTITIDSVSITGGSNNVCLIKYNSNGKIIWGKSFGNEARPQTITHDQFGNIYLGGIFSGDSVKFGSFTLYKGFQNACNGYLIKVDSLGNVIWAQSKTGSNVGTVEALTTDLSGNLYMAGIFSNTISLDNVYTCVGGYDVYVAKLDPGGNVIWAKTLGAKGYEMVQSLGTDVSGNLYLAGSFGDSLFVIGTDTLSNAGYNADIFITKFDKFGNITWSKRTGGGTNDLSTDMEIDPSGNIYLSGFFNSPSLTIGTTTLNNLGYPQGTAMFVAKYNANGIPLWARSADWSTSATSLALDINNDLYVVGNFGYQIILGNDTVQKTMDPPPHSKLYIAKYDSNGNSIWAKGAGTMWNSTVSNVTCDGLGNVYLAGNFNDDTLHLGNIALINSNQPYFFYTYNMFIAKIKNVGFLGFQDIEPSIYLGVYPNPSSGIVTIEFEESSKSKICVYDVLGNCIWNKDVHNESNHKIDLSHRSKGIYFIELIAEQKKSIKKIVID